MEIVALTDTRYSVTCACGRAFKAPRGSLSLECPSCGATALTADLVLTHFSPQAESKAGQPFRRVA